MHEHTPTFFPTPAEFGAWLEEHHATTEHLWVGYYKKATNKPSVTWEDTVDEALCYGWIDGIRKSRDDESYMIRFTPRKSRVSPPSPSRMCIPTVAMRLPNSMMH